MDDWNASGPSVKVDRHATDWGLTSLFIGGFFLIMAPIMLLFNIYTHAVGVRSLNMSDIQIARMVIPLVGLLFLGVVNFGLYAGVRGFSIARSTQQPLALSLGGILCCSVNVLLWIGLTLNLMAVFRMF